MKVSLIGTGLMGAPMVERLLEIGHEVIAVNRTRAKLQPLQKLGAKAADKASDAIHASKITILMVTDTAAISQVLFPPNERLSLKSRTIIQMGTIAPSESCDLGRKVEAEGGDYLEAPVLGSIAEARAGKLLVMVGATQEQFNRWIELFSGFGPEPMLIGSVGKAASLKLALNQLIASHITGFSLSLGLIQRSGIKVDDFMKILGNSTLAAPMFEKKLPRLLNHQYSNPNFPTAHLLKDVNLILEASKGARLETTGIEGIRTLLEKTLEKGLGEVDYSSVFEIVVPKINKKGELDSSTHLQ